MGLRSLFCKMDVVTDILPCRVVVKAKWDDAHTWRVFPRPRTQCWVSCMLSLYPDCQVCYSKNVNLYSCVLVCVWQQRLKTPCVSCLQNQAWCKSSRSPVIWYSQSKEKETLPVWMAWTSSERAGQDQKCGNGDLPVLSALLSPWAQAPQYIFLHQGTGIQQTDSGFEPWFGFSDLRSTSRC